MRILSRIFVFVFLCAIFTAPLDSALAASYGSGRKSYSSSGKSSFSSSRKSSSSSSSSGSRSSIFSSSSRSSSSTPSRSPGFDSAASFAKKAPTAAPRNSSTVTSSRPTYSSSSGRSTYSGGSNYAGATTGYRSPGTPSHAVSTPTPEPVQSARSRMFSRYERYGVTGYRDRISPTFWWWLLDQPRPVRAAWAYHHTDEMDPARYDAMVAADGELPDAVTAMELEKVTPDATFTPVGLERDWMYEDPQPAYVPTRSQGLLFWLVLIGGATFIGWFVFVKRWPGT